MSNRKSGIIPICRIKYQINNILARAAKKRNANKKGKKKEKRVKPSRERPWNTNLLHGRVTRSWTRLFEGEVPAYTLRLRYMCMPLLGDEDLLVPSWEVHILSLAVEFARLALRQP